MKNNTPKPVSIADIAITEAAVRAKYFMDTKRLGVQKPDEGDSAEAVAKSLTKTYLEILNYISIDNAALVTLDGSKRLKIDEVFLSWAKTYYNAEGTIKENIRSKFAKAVTQLHTSFEDIFTAKPSKAIAAELALGVLLCEVGKSDKGREVFPDGIDFSRLGFVAHSGEHLEAALHSNTATLPTPPWYILPESHVVIEGKPYLSYSAKGETFLVTKSGLLAEYSPETQRCVTEQLRANADPDHIRVTCSASESEMPLCLADAIGEMTQSERVHQERAQTSPPAKILPKSEIQRKLQALASASFVDGRDASECANQLVCLEVDFLTGLSIADGANSELGRLQRYFATQDIANFTSLVPFKNAVNTVIHPEKREEEQRRLGEIISHKLTMLTANAPADIKLLIAKAEPNLVRLLPRLNSSADKQFVTPQGQAKKPPKMRSPRACWTQAGPASGKSRLELMFRDTLQNDAVNMVTCSLDAGRPESDEYWLYLGANHHAGDYKRFEQFGSTLRTLTSMRARAGGFDMLYDGTATPFEGKYAQNVQAFKQAGYHTSVIMAAAPLYVYAPDKRALLKPETGEAFYESVARVQRRLVREHRGVPVDVMVLIHIQSSIAAKDAEKCQWVDQHIIIDTSLPHGKESLISYTVDIPVKKLGKLKDLQDNALLQVLDKENMIPHEWQIPLDPGRKREACYRIIRSQKDMAHVEVITDNAKYLSPTFLEKGLLYAQDRGPDALFEHHLAFDLNGRFQREERAKIEAPMVKLDYVSLAQTPHRKMPQLAGAAK